jgi:hypothetical protein
MRTIIHARVEHVEGIQFHLVQSRKPADTATTARGDGFKNRLIDSLSVHHLSRTIDLAPNRL